ncbi:SpaH/EbpB family LPXTG-anchored major pilin [Lapidilactobacillus wuchangensis]|uniref:SpaH/EbpB family LPXTG-anchored major pilin n=1 Tax=Lapidilactobacillus wuchangensis TaxID=2486001 RepID=UPI000F7A2BD0|nr:SpaH/EbpB family LPXTG-anchored major pilin [Lapidilactobacillus wuchangensis]
MKQALKIKVLAASLLLLAAIGMSANANNATVFADTDSTIVDNTTERSITIHKSAGTAAQATGKRAKDDVATGTTADAPTDNSTPLANVPFKIQKIAPLANKSDASIVATDSSTYTVSKEFTGVTGTEFDATTGVKNSQYGIYKQVLGNDSSVDGLYLVTELASPSITTRTSAFIVKVPQPKDNVNESTDGSVTYDVNVYPKNEIVSTELNPTIAFPGQDGGADSQSASGMSQTQFTYKYTINTPKDISSASELSFANKDISTHFFNSYLNNLDITQARDVTVSGEDATGSQVKKLVYSTDFEVNQSGQIKVSLTKAGMAKVATSEKIIVTVPVTARSFAATDNTPATTQVPSNYTVTYTDSVGVTTTGSPAEPATIYFGNLNAKVVDSDGVGISGATFRVATSLQNAKSGKWVNLMKLVGTYGQTAPATVTSDADGNISLDGLQVDPTNKTQTYYLVQTIAPAGYDRDSGIREVTAAADTDLDATFVDSKSFLPDFPLSGSKMNLYMMIAAALLVIIAGTLIVVYNNRRRHSDHHSAR